MFQFNMKVLLWVRFLSGSDGSSLWLQFGSWASLQKSLLALARFVKVLPS